MKSKIIPVIIEFVYLFIILCIFVSSYEGCDPYSCTSCNIEIKLFDFSLGVLLFVFYCMFRFLGLMNYQESKTVIDWERFNVDVIK